MSLKNIVIFYDSTKLLTPFNGEILLAFYIVVYNDELFTIEFTKVSRK